MEYVEIDGVKLRLTNPDELKLEWIGNYEAIKQLLAAWQVLDEKDIPLNPRILGKPGVGKTTLAYAAAQKLAPGNVYIFQCTMDTRPEDLIVQPVIGENNKIIYQASSLVTAMIRGGICILDEANRMSEKSWASLAPLMDKRRYVESIIAGIKIKAHPNFRLCVTMNTDSSTFEIPEYIESRLQPKIYLEFPSVEEEYSILKYNVPYAADELVKYIVGFLRLAHKEDLPFSVRDGINIARYYCKLERFKPDSFGLPGVKSDSLDNKSGENEKNGGYAVDKRLFGEVVFRILGDEGKKLLKKYPLYASDDKAKVAVRSGEINRFFDELREILDEPIDFEDDFDDFMDDGPDIDEFDPDFFDADRFGRMFDGDLSWKNRPSDFFGGGDNRKFFDDDFEEGDFDDSDDNDEDYDDID